MKTAFLYLHISILFAGFTGVFGRLITLNEALLVWYRVMFASCFFLMYFAAKKINFLLPLKDMLRIAWLGLLLAIHWVLFYASIKMSNVSIGVLCIASLCFFTAILDPLMSHRRFCWRELLFSLLTLAGIASIFHFDSRYQAGIVVGLVSAFVCSVMTIETRRISQSYPLTTFLFYQIASCFAIMTLALPVWLHFVPVDTILPSLKNLVYLLLMASFCTVGMFVFQVEALKRLSAFTVNLSYNLEPIYSIIIAMILFNEASEVNASFYVGLVLIGTSVGLQTLMHYKSNQRLAGSKKA